MYEMRHELIIFTQRDITDCMGKMNKGFRIMDPEKQRIIAVMGGKASGGNFKNDRERARRVGKIGGLRSRKKKKV